MRVPSNEQRPASWKNGPAMRLNRILGPVWGPAFVLFIAARAGDVINAITGIWLVPKFVPQAQLGAVLPLTQIAAFVAMPLSLVLTPYAKLLNVHSVRGETGKVKAMVRDATIAAAIALIAAFALTPLFLPLVFRLFAIENGLLALAIILSAVIGALAPIFTETMRALGRFSVVSWTNAAVPVARFAAMAVLLPFRGLTGYFAGQGSSSAFQSGIMLAAFYKSCRKIRPQKWWHDDRKDFFAYLAPIAVLTIFGNLRGVVEVLPFALMPDVESAAWYQLTRFSEIAAYMGAAVVFVLFPVVSARHERGEDTSRLLVRAMSLVMALGSALSLALAASGKAIFTAAGFLAPYSTFTKWLLPLGIMATAKTATTCFTTHEMACRRFSFLTYTVPICLAETLAVYLASGAAPWSPGLGVWHIRHIYAAMASGIFATLIANALHIAARRRRGSVPPTKRSISA